MKHNPQTPERNPSPIIPGSLYTLQDFQKATGMRKTALRTARQNGLRVHYVGNRGYILADDFLDYVKIQGKESNAKK
jgi:hypothetical protein